MCKDTSEGNNRKEKRKEELARTKNKEATESGLQSYTFGAILILQKDCCHDSVASFSFEKLFFHLLQQRIGIIYTQFAGRAEILCSLAFFPGFHTGHTTVIIGFSQTVVESDGSG